LSRWAHLTRPAFHRRDAHFRIHEAAAVGGTLEPRAILPLRLGDGPKEKRRGDAPVGDDAAARSGPARVDPGARIVGSAGGFRGLRGLGRLVRRWRARTRSTPLARLTDLADSALIRVLLILPVHR
jgi:hypothetical protein